MFDVEDEMKLMRILPILLLAVVIVISGCKRSKTEMVTDRSDLVGLSLTAVTNQLGAPYHALDFTVGTAPTKYWHHGIIFGTYPKSDPKNLDVPLKELMWQDGNYMIHVCFHRTNDAWVVLGGTRFHKNIRF